ncbi:M15 family metallopeptidase [uncultured Shewanella sp.]|uniref:M15 family metallopeptidase n=1 Tax=uncultured Shewanella sp. TaxID=173975 RepID=UPI0026281D72|nr:M15 family metallopeptidase [uncultured Shewanella sp.]
MRLDQVLVLSLSVMLSSCSMIDSSHINSNHFVAEAREGIYLISTEECQLMYTSQVLHSDSPIKCDRLKKVVFPFSPLVNKASKTVDIPSEVDEQMSQMGTLVVLDVLAEEVLSLFNVLYQFQFPLKQAIPVEYFSEREKLNDHLNNSYAFDSRLMTNSTAWSEHAYGVAIDINPFQNPYIYIGDDPSALVIPKSAVGQYLNRAKYRPGKVTRSGMAEEVVIEFAKHGFIVWGGDWDRPVDYMHFQVGSRHFIDKLTSLPLASASALFNDYVIQINRCFDIAKDTLGFNDQELIRKFCVDTITTKFE